MDSHYFFKDIIDKRKTNHSSILKTLETLDLSTIISEINHFKNNLRTTTFDMEVSLEGKKIKEFSYKTNNESTNLFESSDVNNSTLSKLVNELKKCNIVIGHNIINNDLPILERETNNDISFEQVNETVWDTLYVEMMLEPHRPSYALKTTHNSKEDTEKTYRLFIDQLKRIIRSYRPSYIQKKMDGSLTNFSKYHSSLLAVLGAVFAYARGLEASENLQDSNERSQIEFMKHFVTFFETDTDEVFFESVHREKSFTTKTLKYDKDNLLIVPQRYWEEISRVRRSIFLPKYDRLEYKSLNEHKIESIEDIYIKNYLLKFRSYDKYNKEITSRHLICHLPQFIRSKDVEHHIDDATLIQVKNELKSGELVCEWNDLSSIDFSEYKKIIFFDTCTADFDNQYTVDELPLHSLASFWDSLKGKDYLTDQAIIAQIIKANNLHDIPENSWLEIQENCIAVKTRLDYPSLKKEILEEFPHISTSKRIHDLTEFNTDTITDTSGSLPTDLPIVYIASNPAMISTLEYSANRQGFKVFDRTKFSLFRRLELLAECHRNQEKAVCIVTCDEFFKLCNFVTDQSYRFIWSLREDQKQIDICGKSQYQNISYFIARSNEWNNGHSILDKNDTFLNDISEDSSLGNIKEGKDFIHRLLLQKDDKFTDEQEQILDKVLLKDKSYAISLPTGGGKSLLFQGPSLYLSNLSGKLSLVITPLKALMEDQVKKFAVKPDYKNKVEYINGDRFKEYERINERIRSGEIELLYVSPEHLMNHSFSDALQFRMCKDNGLEYIIFDEAHCICMWGQNFRPGYMRALKKCLEFKSYYTNICLLFFSATMTANIIQELQSFAKDLEFLNKGNIVREDIDFEFEHIETSTNDSFGEKRRREAIRSYFDNSSEIMQNLTSKRSRMIIFCRTHAHCETLAGKLSDEAYLNKLNISFFHAELDPDLKQKTIEDFKSGKTQILCATKAFGMGIDIPNIHYVIHYSPTETIEDYLQEIGRCGRNKKMLKEAGFIDGKKMKALCLYSDNDMQRLNELHNMNSLTWQDLKDIQKTIKDYYQKVFNDKLNTISIRPFIWHKDNQINCQNSTDLGLYYLENAGILSFEGYSANLFDITLINEDDSPKEKRESRKNNLILQTIRKQYHSIDQDKWLQINPMLLSSVCNVPQDSIIDGIQELHADGKLKIHSEIHCRILPDGIYDLTENFKISKIEIFLKFIKKYIETFDGTTPAENKKIVELIYKLYPEPTDTERHILNDLIYQRLKYTKPFMKTFLMAHVQFTDSGEFQIITDIHAIEKELNKIMSDCFSFMKFIGQEYEDREISLFSKDNHISFNPADITYENAKKSSDHEACSERKWSINKYCTITRFLSWMDYITINDFKSIGFLIKIKDLNKSIDSDVVLSKKFDEIGKMQHARITAMDILTQISDSSYQKKFIQKYFLCANVKSVMDLLQNELNNKHTGIISKIWDDNIEEAFMSEKRKISNNKEQWEIYEKATANHTIVKAGPGTGKTYILMMLCIKIIKELQKNPRNILILAYNNAVIAEIRRRLFQLLSDMCLGYLVSRIKIYTFHSFLKKFFNELDPLDINSWESKIDQQLDPSNEQQRKKICMKLGNKLDYILIDEFQDINEHRLNILGWLCKMFPHCKTFAVGDLNQSIYGYNRFIPNIPESYSAQYYYNKWLTMLKDSGNVYELELTKNHRSQSYINNFNTLLINNRSLSELKEYCKELNNGKLIIEEKAETDSIDLKKDFMDLIRKYHDIAFLFRTNAEAIDFHNKVKQYTSNEVEITLQWQDNNKFSHTREVHGFLQYLCVEAGKHDNMITEQTVEDWRLPLHEFLDFKIKEGVWNAHLLRIIKFLLDCYLEERLTQQYGFDYIELYDYFWKSNITISDAFTEYEKHLVTDHIQHGHTRVTISTIHKVKGLEYDAVVVAPSVSMIWNPDDRDQSAFIDEIYAEEKRVLYVATTRAKTYLKVYMGPREQSLFNREIQYKTENLPKRGISDLSDIDLGFLYNKWETLRENRIEYIKNQVKIGDQVILNDKNELKHNNVTIGHLSHKRYNYFLQDQTFIIKNIMVQTCQESAESLNSEISKLEKESIKNQTL